MPRVRFTISYAVDPAKKAVYLEHIRHLRDHLEASGRGGYAIFETRGKKDLFTEVFESSSLADHEALEDDQDETTLELVRKIEACKVKGSTRYTTQVEVTDETG